MTPVTEYIKNVGKSIKYLTFDEYIGDNAPATKQFLETNGELFTDIYHATVHPFRTIKKVQKALTNNDIYRMAEEGFQNSINSLKTGNLYDKTREDSAWEKSFGNFDEGEDDMNWDSEESESSNNNSSNERAIANATIRSSEISTNAITGTVESSARYLGGISKANTTVLYKQAQLMSNTLHNGFMSLGSGIDQLNKFNTEVVQTVAKNANTYFQTTTDIMKENKAILKEMLQMQRNLYKNADANKDRKYGDSDYSKIFANGLNIKELGKMMIRNTKNYLSDELMLDKETLGMLGPMLANPLAFIGTKLIGSMIGPAFTKSLKNFDKTFKGMFGTFISKMMFKGNDPNASFGQQLLGKLFGIKGIGKTGIDTSNAGRMGAIPFDWQTKRAITEVIPTYLSHIESALTGKATKIYDDKSGKWITEKALKKDFEGITENYKLQGSQRQMSEMRYVAQKAYNKSGMDEREIAKNMQRFNQVLETIAKKQFDDNGHMNMNMSTKNTNADEAEYYKLSPKDIDMFKQIWSSISKETRMQTSGEILRSKTNYNEFLKDAEASGEYNRLFNNSISGPNKTSATRFDKYYRDKKGNILERPDIEREMVGGVFNLNNMADKYNKTVFDYLRSIDLNIAGLGFGGGSGYGGKGTGPVGGGSPRRNRNRRRKYRNAYDRRSLNAADKAAREEQDMYDEEESENQIDELTPAMRKMIEEAKEEYAKVTDFSQKNELDDKLVDKIASVAGSLDAFKHELKNMYKDLKGDEVANSFDDDYYQTKWDKWVKKNFGELGDNIQAPGNFGATIIDNANNVLFKQMFGEEYGKNESDNPLLNGPGKEKYKGIIGKITFGIENMFKRINENMDENEKDKVKGFANALNDSIKDITGVDIKGIMHSGMDQGKELLKNSVNTVVHDAASVYRQFNPRSGPRRSIQRSKANTENFSRLSAKGLEQAETEIANASATYGDLDDDDVFNVSGFANGTRQVTKGGLAVLSPGEMVIPNSPNQQKIDYKNEKNFVKNLKEKLNNVQHYAFGNVGDKVLSALGVVSSAVRKEFGSPDGTERTTADTVGMAENKGKGEYRNRVMDLVFGDEDKESRKKTEAQIGKAEEEIKSSLTKIGGAGVLGLVGGTLVGGPLVGAMLGVSGSMISNSNTLQELAFGKEIVGKDGKKTRKNGLLGDSGEKIQKSLKKYIPDIGKYGTVGVIAGAVTGLGPLPGILLGSAMGFAKNSEGVQKAIFGVKDGLINDETKAMLKKMFPGMAKGGLAAALFAGAAGLGGAPLLGIAALGTGLGMVSSTDEFKDAILGKKDKDGKRHGGVLEELKNVVVKPFEGFRDGIKKWFEDDFVGPIKRSIAPIGKQLELAVKGISSTVTGGIKALFTSKTGIPFIDSLKNGMFGKTVGGMFKLGEKAVKGAGWVASSPSAFIGAIGDKLRKHQVRTGNADYMTSEDRLKLMGDENYDFKDVDSKLAGTSLENLELMREQVGMLNNGKGFLDDEYQKQLSKVGSSISGGMKNNSKAKEIMKLIQSPDEKDHKAAITLINQSRELPMAERTRLIEMLNTEGNKLRQIGYNRDNYKSTQEDHLQKLRDLGLTGINADNIDKYTKLISAEADGRLDSGALTEGMSEEDKTANALADTINNNFDAAIPELQKTNKELLELRKQGAKLPEEIAKAFNGQLNRETKYAEDEIGKEEDYRNDEAKRANLLSGNNHVFSEEEKDLLTSPKSFSEKAKGLIGKDKSGRMASLRNKGNQVDLKGFYKKGINQNRILNLMEAGMKVKSSEYEAISKLDKKEYKLLLKILKAGVKIDSIADIMPIFKEDTDGIANKLAIISNGIPGLSTKELVATYKKTGGNLIANPDAMERSKELIANRNADKEISNAMAEEHPASESSLAEKAAELMQSQGGLIPQNAFGDLLGSGIEKLSTVSAGEMIGKASDFMKKHKVGEKLSSAANWLDAHASKSGGNRVKALYRPTKQSASPSSASNAVSSGAGGASVNSLGQTMKMGSSGEMIVENTEANKKIEQAEAAKNQVQYDILDTLKQILGVNEAMVNPDEMPKEKKGFLSTLLGILAAFMPAKLMKYWESAKNAFKFLEKTAESLGKGIENMTNTFSKLKKAVLPEGLSTGVKNMFSKIGKVGKAMKGKTGFAAVAAGALAAYTLFSGDDKEKLTEQELKEKDALMKQGYTEEQADAIIQKQREDSGKGGNQPTTMGRLGGAAALTTASIGGAAIADQKVRGKLGEKAISYLREKGIVGPDISTAELWTNEKTKLNKEQLSRAKELQEQVKSGKITQEEKIKMLQDEFGERRKRLNDNKPSEIINKEKGITPETEPTVESKKNSKWKTAGHAFGLYNAYSTISDIKDFITGTPEQRQQIIDNFNNSSLLSKGLTVAQNAWGLNDAMHIGENAKGFAEGIGLGGKYEQAANFLSGKVSPITEKLGSAGTFISEHAGAAGKAISGATSSMGSAISSGAESIVKAIMGSIDTVLNFISKPISLFGGNHILEVIAQKREALTKFLTSGGVAKSIMSKAGVILKKVALPLSIAFAVSAFYDGFSNCSSILELPEEIKNPSMSIKILCGVFSALYSLTPFGIIWETFKQFFDAILGVVGLKEDFNAWIKESANTKGFTDEIADTVSENYKEVTDLLNDSEIIPDWMKTNNEMSGADRALEAAKTVLKFTPLGISIEAGKRIKPIFKSIVDSTKEFFTGIFNQVQNIIDKVTAPFTNAINAIKDTFSNLFKPLTDKISEIKESFANFYKNLFGDDNKETPKSKTTMGRLTETALKYGTKLYRWWNGDNKEEGKGKWGKGSYVGFHSQLDPSSSMQFNASGDTTYQNMADSGCGPVSAANIGSAFGVPMDSKDAASYALKNGYKEKNGGTKPEFFDNYLGKYGIGTSNISASNARDSLKNGNPVLLMGTDDSNTPEMEAYGRSKTPFGTNPHYVVATGLDSKDNITIQDPESNIPSQKYKAKDVLSNSTLAKSARYGKGNLRFGLPKYGRGSNGEHIWQYLKAKGLGSKSIAGIMGNMYAESGLMPDRVQGDGVQTAKEITVDGVTGYGLCQWTSEGRQQALVDFAKSRGTSTSDVDTQLDFMLQEIGSDSGLLSKMENAKDEHDAALIFHKEFERSADTPEMADRRGVYATEIAKSEGKGESFGGTYTGSSNGSKPGSANSSGRNGIFGALDSIKNMLGSMIGLGSSSSASTGGNSNFNGGVVPGSTEAGNKVVELARSYIPKLGGPGHYTQGSGREDIDNGTSDCSGFVNAIYQRAFGSDTAIKNGFTGNGDAQMQSIPGTKFTDKSQVAPGDVIFMDYGNDGNSPSTNLNNNICDHVGLVSGPGKMIDIGNNTTGLSERSWDWVDNRGGSEAFIRPNLITGSTGANTSPASTSVTGKGKWGRGKDASIIDPSLAGIDIDSIPSYNLPSPDDDDSVRQAKIEKIKMNFLNSNKVNEAALSKSSITDITSNVNSTENMAKLQKPKKKKNFLEKIFDAFISPSKTAIKTGDILRTNNANLVDGKYEKNDVDYLMNQGYSKEDAIKLLSQDPKYANKSNTSTQTLEQRMTNQSFNLDNISAQGIGQTSNATVNNNGSNSQVQISNGGTTALNNALGGTVDYTEKFDKMISLLSVIAESLSKASGVAMPDVNSPEGTQRMAAAKVANKNSENLAESGNLDFFANIARSMNMLATK